MGRFIHRRVLVMGLHLPDCMGDWVGRYFLEAISWLQVGSFAVLWDSGGGPRQRTPKDPLFGHDHFEGFSVTPHVGGGFGAAFDFTPVYPGFQGGGFWSSCVDSGGECVRGWALGSAGGSLGELIVSD